MKFVSPVLKRNRATIDLTLEEGMANHRVQPGTPQECEQCRQQRLLAASFQLIPKPAMDAGLGAGKESMELVRLRRGLTMVGPGIETMRILSSELVKRRSAPARPEPEVSAVQEVPETEPEPEVAEAEAGVFSENEPEPAEVAEPEAASPASPASPVPVFQGRGLLAAAWRLDLPPPSTEYPLAALLGDVDLAVASSRGDLGNRAGPVHLNFCFRENLAPDAGPVRGYPGRSSEWDKGYVDTAQMHSWAQGKGPRSRYVSPAPTLRHCEVLEELVAFAKARARIIVLVGTLDTREEVLLAEDIAARLGAPVFADITSGLRQRPSCVAFSDQLLNSPLLTPELLRLDAVVHLGGAMVSARHNAFAKAGVGALYVRVANAPVRMDQDYVVTHHLPCGLASLCEGLVEAGLQPEAFSSPFWRRLSAAAGRAIDRTLGAGGFSEPMVAQAVSRLLAPQARLLISSSMPIRDLDFFAKPCADLWQAPVQPPLANRGASGIDGVISTAAGVCTGCKAPCTLVIGDVASLQDLGALQLLAGQALPLTVVLINNGGGGIFSFLPIAKHQDVMNPFFNEPHSVDFESACSAFGVPHVLCRSMVDFEAAFMTAQSQGSGCVIEVQPSLNFEENVALHKRVGQEVACAVRKELLSQVNLSWTYSSPSEALSTGPVVLLHGWLGEKADWLGVSQILVEEHGCSVLTLDLPGHGDSQVEADDPWAASTLFSLPLVVEALADLFDRLHLDRVLLAGYSLGGRVAMAFADSFPQRCLGLVALSANPGISLGARLERWQQDQLQAQKLLEGMDAFLSKWYKAPLWAGLQDRRPDVYARMMEKRRRNHVSCAARSLLGLSLAHQPDFRHLRLPFWYMYGELDTKFAEIGKELASTATVESLPCGHAVVEECPREVASLLARASQQTGQGVSKALEAEVEAEVQIQEAWMEHIQLTLKAPLLLARGDVMPQRCGVLLVLQAKSGDGELAGLGEVTPLPLFHKETLAEAQAQLAAVLQHWSASKPRVPVAVTRLDGSMGRWLEQHCLGPLLPSVRAGLEMALLHLLRGHSGPVGPQGPKLLTSRGRSCHSAVSINSLLARDEDGLNGAAVAKLKVGLDPAKDAERTNSLAEKLLRQTPHARLRLDANRAWTLDQANCFLQSLSDSAVAMTEYLEEPLQLPEPSSELLQHWEELAVRSGRRVAFAVDESLTEGIVSLEDLSQCKALAALVLKPSLQGLEQTVSIAAWAVEHGARPVLSSAFESGVALCHFALLSATLAPGAVAQGIGTFARLSEDVLQPPFADLVISGPGGWQVTVVSCQEALDHTVKALVAARGSDARANNGWCGGAV
ncbi:unnamed protein product [Effrenium voratum]|nr:unnamed protein product [Effrenium voratum]